MFYNYDDEENKLNEEKQNENISDYQEEQEVDNKLDDSQNDESTVDNDLDDSQNDESTVDNDLDDSQNDESTNNNDETKYDDHEYYESKYEDEQLRDRYYDNRNTYNDNHNNNNNKKDNGSYVSKKTVTLIVTLCLVLAIICAICVGVMSSSLRQKLLESAQTTVETPVQTQDSSSNTTQTEKQTTSSETTANVPTSVVIGNVTLTANDIGGTELSVKDVFKKVNESVVIIKSYTSSSGSLGSGVVVTADGYIITNYHVANPGNTSIEIDFADGSVYEAKYVLGDEESDVALLKVEKTNCAYAEIANSNQIEIGDVAVVIGNALGRGITLTSGYISALSRTINVDGNVMTLLQTDATINSGNSGGGLFNIYGQLVALVNSKTGGSTVEGTGYAIPMNDVIKVINDLQTNGYITGKARLGITMNLLGSSFSSYGYIQVKSILENGSCATTDLKVNDILYKLDGTTLSSVSVLSEALSKYSVGDTVKLTVLRPTKDISEFRTQSWFIGTISYDYEAYLNACEEITIDVTFVEFNPGL